MTSSAGVQRLTRVLLEKERTEKLFDRRIAIPIPEQLLNIFQKFCSREQNVKNKTEYWVLTSCVAVDFHLLKDS